MADFRKFTAHVLLTAFLSASLSGCLRSEVAEPAETGGIGRYAPGERPPETAADVESETAEAPETDSGNVGYTPPPLDNKPNTQTSETTEISYKIEDGKYVYTFSEPDRSRMNDTSWLSSVSKALFSDQGEDASGSWYFGKVKRDLTTGEISYVWDRSADTVELIKQYGGIYRQNEEEKVCYLTFDCGYENGYTDPVLDVLKEKNVPGIFFVTGQYVDTAGDQIRRMIDEGHIIGNHPEHHYNATGLSPETFREEIESVERKMESLYGYTEPMQYWRPPQGGCNEYVLAMSEAMGLHTVLWSFAHYDYDTENQPDYATALQKAKEGLHPGCVYLFHTVSKTNAEILSEFIDWVRAQGYEIRPICG